MERLIAWVWELDFFWFLIDNAGALMAITVLIWLRSAAIHLSQIFSED